MDKVKFEQEVITGIKPAMGNNNTIIEVVGNILGGYVKEAVELSYQKKASGELVIPHPWGLISITNGVNPQFECND